MTHQEAMAELWRPNHSSGPAVVQAVIDLMFDPERKASNTAECDGHDKLAPACESNTGVLTHARTLIAPKLRFAVKA